MATTIAVLGATGKTGREVLQRLLPKQDIDIRIYVRSRSKLLNIFPSLSSDSHVSIFAGPLQDINNMSKCLDGAQKIIFTLGENDNIAGVSVIEDGAKAVLAALAALKQERKDWQRPQVILLSSATWNTKFAATRPALIHWAIQTAFMHPYADLRRGSAVFRDATSLVGLLLVQPNALIEAEPTGHEVSTEWASLSVTYGDLGAGIVDVACEQGYGTVTAVGVSSKGGDNPLKVGHILAYRIIRGLCATYIPGFWPVNRFVNATISTLTFKRKTT